MNSKEKFVRFIGVWVTYLIGSFALLKWMLVPRWGDVCVMVAVALGLSAWVLAFIAWGPIRGNWDTGHAEKCCS